MCKYVYIYIYMYTYKWHMCPRSYITCVGCLDDWLVAWLVCWLAGWLAGQFGLVWVGCGEVCVFVLCCVGGSGVESGYG